jgi:Xaa-Pro dipeptidase
MNRRNFIKTTGSATALAVLSPSLSSSRTVLSPESVSAKVLHQQIKPITAEERLQRQEQARKLMHEHKIDALLLEGGTSLHYFTGVSWGRSERLFAMILPQKGEPVFIAPKFEEGRAKEQVGTAKLYTWEEDQSPYALVEKILSDLHLLSGTLGIEESTRYFVAGNIQKEMATLRIQSGTAVTAGCRSLKSSHEIELMQIANDITAEVFKAAVLKLREGMSEVEFGKIISQLFSESGVQGGALVLFGVASAYPHGLVKENRLKEGDVVLIDGGCSVEGYESDVTRTTVFGKASEKIKTTWEIVRLAQETALKTAKPGVLAEAVDAAARKIISDKGFGPGYTYFTHRLGHGIGMDGHEWYYLVGGNKRPLETGNMFSNEPGIYIVNEFGIRIEDEMLITQDGARLLLPQAKSLDILF